MVRRGGGGGEWVELDEREDQAQPEGGQVVPPSDPEPMLGRAA